MFNSELGLQLGIPNLQRDFMVPRAKNTRPICVHLVAYLAVALIVVLLLLLLLLYSALLAANPKIMTSVFTSSFPIVSSVANLSDLF